MKAWSTLYQQQRDMRAGARELEGALRRRLVELANRGHCAATIQGRFTKRDSGPRRELYIQPIDPGDKREPLISLPSLKDARLTVLALLSKRSDHVHQFTAMIEGTTQAGARWAAAVHLEEDYASAEQDRKGSGACGHAAFHCHVGPTLDDAPKVRVPVPAVGPAESLDWLFSIVVPSWEPAPWPEVVADLSRKEPPLSSSTR